MRNDAERIAQAFHETYERLAPEHGYETREASAKPWSEVPEQNRNLMIAVVSELLDRDIIRRGVPSAVEDLRRSTRWRPTDPQIKPTQ